MSCWALVESAARGMANLAARPAMRASLNMMSNSSGLMTCLTTFTSRNRAVLVWPVDSSVRILALRSPPDGRKLASGSLLTLRILQISLCSSTPDAIPVEGRSMTMVPRAMSTDLTRVPTSMLAPVTTMPTMSVRIEVRATPVMFGDPDALVPVMDNHASRI